MTQEPVTFTSKSTQTVASKKGRIRFGGPEGNFTTSDEAQIYKLRSLKFAEVKPAVKKKAVKKSAPKKAAVKKTTLKEMAVANKVASKKVVAKKNRKKGKG